MTPLITRTRSSATWAGLPSTISSGSVYPQACIKSSMCGVGYLYGTVFLFNWRMSTVHRHLGLPSAPGGLGTNTKGEDHELWLRRITP